MVPLMSQKKMIEEIFIENNTTILVKCSRPRAKVMVNQQKLELKLKPTNKGEVKGIIQNLKNKGSNGADGITAKGSFDSEIYGSSREISDRFVTH
ncbi:hypothetical protein HHI36_002029 [Cryptolaemus montrouzieri]|uniref:Uncharacterized protein n=1 Tax=Cryptolaemus montrouzieri TaxID=559131 RepID=A0ABD2PA26_9CUCU